MSNIYSALEYIARRDIPEQNNLWPQIAARIERKDAVNMNPKLKLVWTVLLVVLGLILATTAAYAVYRYFADPGLQAVNEAGMFTDINSTAQPTVLPTQPPDTTSGVATVVGLEQTQNGVTVRLEWVSLLDPRQIFEVSAQGLGPQMEFGMPRVTYPGVAPQQYESAIFSLSDGPVVTGRYVSYQILRKDGKFGGQVEMQIDLPLLQRTGDELSQVANFHFDLKDIPVVVPNGWGGSNAYSVRVNGLEIRQVYSIVTPSYTLAHVCYDVPSTGDWVITDATIQFSGQQPGLLAPLLGYTQTQDENGQRCADLRFLQGKSKGDISFSIKVNGLMKNSGQEKIDSSWQLYTGLVDDIQVVGAPNLGTVPAPTSEMPLEAQTNGDLTVTLLSVYADANRLAVTLRVDGKASDAFVSANLTDAEGYDINSAYSMGSPEGHPDLYILTFVPEDMSHSAAQGFSPKAPLADRHFEGRLNITTRSMDGAQAETAFHFDLSVPIYPALIVEPKQILTANGIEMRLEKLKITPSYTRLYVCYKKPTSSDWTVGASSTLQIGPDEVHADSYGLVADSDYNTGKGPDPDFAPSTRIGRCVKLGYPVGHHNQPEVLTLSIPELQQSLPEVIPDDQVKKAQAAMSAQGIEIDYVTFRGNGGGGGGPAIKKKPAGMSDQEAMRLFYAALGYYHPGPWVFTISINP